MRLNFESIGLEKQAAYRDRLARCPQITSDYSFINLWAWGPEYGLEWAWADDLVWIRKGAAGGLFWAPVGDWRTVDWPAVLASAAEDNARFERVPEALADLWRKSGIAGLSIEENRDHWDYVYSVEELIELKGNRFHKKKNLLNQFLKKYDFSYLPLGPELIRKTAALQEQWCLWRDCEGSDTLTAENRAIARALSVWDQMTGLCGGAVVSGETLVGYTFGEILPDQSMVIHFEKADAEYKGAYQAINQIFLEMEARSLKRVNREQDLGDEGLRKAKLSYNPIDFLKKFTIRLGPAAEGLCGGPNEPCAHKRRWRAMPSSRPAIRHTNRSSTQSITPAKSKKPPARSAMTGGITTPCLPETPVHRTMAPISPPARESQPKSAMTPARGGFPPHASAAKASGGVPPVSGAGSSGAGRRLS